MDEGNEVIKEGYGETIREMWGFIIGLRKRKFDVVLDFHGILKSGLLSFLSGSPKRIGYDRRSTKEGNFLFSNIKVKLPKGRISRFQRNLALLRGMGLEVKEFKYQPSYPPEDQEYVESFFKGFISLPEETIDCNPSGNEPKGSFQAMDARSICPIGGSIGPGTQCDGSFYLGRWGTRVGRGDSKRDEGTFSFGAQN